MKRLALIALLALTACGGGGSSAPDVPHYAVRMSARLAHRGLVPADPGSNASIITPADSLSVADSVAQQASAPEDVAITIGPAKSLDFSALPAYLAAAQSHPNVRWVYLYDELFWAGSVQIGSGESEVTQAAKQVQAAGLKTAVTMLPDVILDPKFALQHPDAFDVIVIDLYPAGRPTNVSCPGANPYTALLGCSVQRLRGIGFQGQVWYAYEAFGDSDVPDLPAKLQLQREAIAAAPALGISGLVAFGYWDETHTNLLPPLYPGHGSAIDALVNLETMP